MSKDFIMINSWIYHGQLKPAKHLSDGEHILFGGKVWMVIDAEFIDSSPSDLRLKLVTVQKTTDDRMEKQEQGITVNRDFEVQPLVIAVLPIRSEDKVGA